MNNFPCEFFFFFLNMILNRYILVYKYKVKRHYACKFKVAICTGNTSYYITITKYLFPVTVYGLIHSDKRLVFITLLYLVGRV